MTKVLEWFDNSSVEFCASSVPYVVKESGFISENHYSWSLALSTWNHADVIAVTSIERQGGLRLKIAYIGFFINNNTQMCSESALSRISWPEKAKINRKVDKYLIHLHQKGCYLPTQTSRETITHSFTS